MTRKSFYQRVPPSPPSPGILQSKEGPCTSGLICRIVIFTIIFVRIVIHTWEETQGGFWVVFARLARFADWAILPSWTPPPPPPPPGSCPLGQRRKRIFRYDCAKKTNHGLLWETSDGMIRYVDSVNLLILFESDDKRYNKNPMPRWWWWCPTRPSLASRSASSTASSSKSSSLETKDLNSLSMYLIMLMRFTFTLRNPSIKSVFCCCEKWRLRWFFYFHLQTFLVLK